MQKRLHVCFNFGTCNSVAHASYPYTYCTALLYSVISAFRTVVLYFFPVRWEAKAEEAFPRANLVTQLEAR